MRYSQRASRRQALSLALFALAVATSACSGSNTATSPMQVVPKVKLAAVTWNFTPVTFGAASGLTDSMVTGINDGTTSDGIRKQRIIGVVEDPSTGVYNGYTSWCSPNSSSYYVCGEYKERDYPGASNTYLAGQDQGKFEVGWAVPPLSVDGPACDPCGFTRILNSPGGDTVQRNSGSGSFSCFNAQTGDDSKWCMFKEPDQGSGSCAVTEILGVDDSEEPVGFYDVASSSGGCTQQAFGMNVISTGSGSYTYYKFTPPNATWSIATGKADTGDVIGTMSTGSSSKDIKGWIFTGSTYTEFQCGGGANETHALGVVGAKSNLVVGYYVDSMGTHGFYVRNPATQYPICEKIDYANNTSGTVILTAVTGIDDKDDISGYFQAEGSSTYQGFIGYCTPKTNC